ncbi:hypothetical protein G6F51_014286 [Rhizopus arrhizus]|uniref:Uncharacterized protein n=1 Tax=Rhizopus oryzae TaxID=64495 RepID=A0A9P6XNP5_RHIOR|nr:hypothetical protein G6F51_014286 [Rhizopus arrhizus]
MVKRGLQISCPEPGMVTTFRALTANRLIQTRLDNPVELKSQCIKIGTYGGVDTICRGIFLKQLKERSYLILA